MKVLFIHQNFPGQFRNIAQYLVERTSHRVLAIGRDTAPGMEGVRLLRYKLANSHSPSTNIYLRSMADGIGYGTSVASLLEEIKLQGYIPDVIIAHPGWGESLFAKDIYPRAKLIHFCEYYYHAHGADAGFDPEFKLSQIAQQSIRIKNAIHLLSLETCDAGIAPTKWQHSLHPKAYQHKIAIAHEGIDIAGLKRNTLDEITLPSGRKLRRGARIVTYVARNLEPYRGFHTFMRALPKLLKADPQCEVVIVGGDGVSYGKKPVDAKSWKEKLCLENEFDHSRVHFMGRVPYDIYKSVLRLSSVHVYLTYPFVLSWSLLEAMAAGCLVVASDTEPVREVIQHGKNGFLVDFFDHVELANVIANNLESGLEYSELRLAAISSVRKYHKQNGIDNYMNVINAVLTRGLPSV